MAFLASPISFEAALRRAYALRPDAEIAAQAEPVTVRVWICDRRTRLVQRYGRETVLRSDGNRTTGRRSGVQGNELQTGEPPPVDLEGLGSDSVVVQDEQAVRLVPRLAIEETKLDTLGMA